MSNGNESSGGDGESGPIAAALDSLTGAGAANLDNAAYEERVTRLDRNLAEAFRPRIDELEEEMDELSERREAVTEAIEANRTLIQNLSAPAEMPDIGEVSEQKAALAGRVETEGEEGTPVVGATIIFDENTTEETRRASTDIHGRFVLYTDHDWFEREPNVQVMLDGEPISASLGDFDRRQGRDNVFDVVITVTPPDGAKFEEIASAFRAQVTKEREAEAEQLEVATNWLRGADTLARVQANLLRSIARRDGDED